MILYDARALVRPTHAPNVTALLFQNFLTIESCGREHIWGARQPKSSANDTLSVEVQSTNCADQWPDKTGPARKKNLSLHFGKRVYRFNHRPSSLLVPFLSLLCFGSSSTPLAYRSLHISIYRNNCSKGGTSRVDGTKSCSRLAPSWP